MQTSELDGSSAESFVYNDDTTDVPETVLSAIVTSSIARLPDMAFSKCRYLKKVNFPLGLQAIGEEVFKGCSALIEIDIPSTVTSIQAGAFQDCSSLARVTFASKHSGLQVVSPRTFQNCYNLRKILIPNTVTAIEEEAFQYCLQLVSIELDTKNALNEIGPRCFEACESLRNFYLVVDRSSSSSSNLLIGEGAFDFYGSFSHILKDPEVIIPTLKCRFDGLDLHKLCYTQAFLTQERLLFRLGELLSEGRMSTNNMDEPFGMTPLHILAMSTGPNLYLCEALLQEYPTDLLKENVWGDRPLYEACACNAPLDIIQLFVDTLLQNFPDEAPDWLSLIHVTDAAETIQYLVRSSLAQKINYLGLERWRISIIGAVKEVGTAPPKMQTMIHYNRSELTGKPRIIQQIGHIHHRLDQLVRLEILSLLELAVWKAKIMDGPPNIDRPTCRVQCGVEVVVKNVLSFMDTIGE